MTSVRLITLSNLKTSFTAHKVLDCSYSDVFSLTPHIEVTRPRMQCWRHKTVKTTMHSSSAISLSYERRKTSLYNQNWNLEKHSSVYNRPKKPSSSLGIHRDRWVRLFQDKNSMGIIIEQTHLTLRLVTLLIWIWHWMITEQCWQWPENAESTPTALD